VSPFAPDPGSVQRIDAALAEWRQGDVALEEQWFAHVGDPSEPLTVAASEVDGEEPQTLTSEVAGLVVVTQSCDVVRSCVSRSFVEVSPLVEVSDEDLQQIRRARQPRYAFVPATESDRLVADLDRVMTVEKAIVARWRRTRGCLTDEQVREFADALARKRQRFAFPDDFTALATKLRQRLAEKHDKNSPEGRALRALRQIRVRAAPSWVAGQIEVFFFFIREEDVQEFEGKGWDVHLERWLKLIPASGRFSSVDGVVVPLDQMTAREHVESDPLDLDQLSMPSV
jgi:hypothetical protein